MYFGSSNIWRHRELAGSGHRTHGHLCSILHVSCFFYFSSYSFSHQHLCLLLLPVADPQQEFERHIVSAEREPITGRGLLQPLKIKAFLHFQNLRSWPICHKICFGRTKNFVETRGSARLRCLIHQARSI